MRALLWLMGLMVLIIIGSLLIFGGNKKPTHTTNTPVILPLADYASTDATVSMTIDGVVNGDDAHRAIRITVGRDQRTLDIVQGYSGHVLERHAFYNTEDAYNVFLRSINNGGFMLKNKNKKISSSPTGQCPLEKRYIFNLDQGADTLSSLWTSDCGTKTGTFSGSLEVVQRLFENQITDYNNLISEVELN
ncbi:hypothetical protein KW789_00200 [Candidatus Saccharibacteria bacterium]|jgi:hypothetical protein|nr:hypothetical protein [Candidatus Saccharibacteria bacterium]